MAGAALQPLRGGTTIVAFSTSSLCCLLTRGCVLNKVQQLPFSKGLK
jgi:hypothetical protein